MTYPANGRTNTESYTYNALGEVTGYTDRNGNTHSYSYDVLRREISDVVTTFGSGVDQTVKRLDTAYDTGGRPYKFTSYADTAGTTIVNQVQQVYNGLGQLITEYQSHAGAVSTSFFSTTPNVQYAYSFVAASGGPNHSRPVSMTYPNGSAVNYNYTEANGVDNRISRLSDVSFQGAIEFYTYLGLNTVVQRSQYNSSSPVVNMTYIIPGGNTDGGDKYTGLDRFGRVVEQRWVNPNTNSLTDDFLYTYDRDSDRLTRSNGLNSSFSEQYSYDNLNRLTSFTRGSHTQSWGLDAVGNWNSFTNDGSTQTRSFNNQNQITGISNATTPAYDNNGNTTSDETGKTYTYDAWNRLVKVVSGSNTEVYGYDALGRRITITLNGSTTDLYYSSAWQVIEEDVGGSMQTQYVWSPLYVDALVARYTSNNTVLYVQQDANWSVTAMVDSGSNVQERYAYDPYGKPSFYSGTWQPLSGSGINWLYLFQGGRYDTTSGLYNFRNRDLSPTLGRWMEQDPIGYAGGG